MSKTKEHVLPKWLIELTGDPQRLGYWGSELQRDSSEGDQFPFAKLTAPACAVCNHKFGALERGASRVVRKMLETSSLSSGDALVLLDWLDKVRAGLWLTHLQRNNEFGVRPHYRIENRISLFDRAAFIAFSSDDAKALHIYGLSSPMFVHQPCCFGLRINNCFILNISSFMMLSEGLGMTYPNLLHLMDYGSAATGFRLANGTGKESYPVIKGLTPLPGICIAQPIAPGTIPESVPDSSAIKYFPTPSERAGYLLLISGQSIQIDPPRVQIPSSNISSQLLSFMVRLNVTQGQSFLINMVSGDLLADEDKRAHGRFRQACAAYAEKHTSILRKEFSEVTSNIRMSTLE